MPDGNFVPIDVSVKEPLRQLEVLPADLDEFIGGFDNELSALGSYKEGLMQNAQLLWTYRREISEKFKELCGRPLSEDDMKTLVKAAIVTDLGKVGSEPVKPGEMPQNLVARVYREFRWTKAHSDRTGMSKSEISFGEAVEVMKQMALEDPEANIEEINSTFKFDEDELKQYGFDANSTLAEVFTGLHLKAGEKLFARLGIEGLVRDLALGHHFSGGLKLLPEDIVARYHLTGKDEINPDLIEYVTKVSLLMVTDKLQAFAQRPPERSDQENKDPVLLTTDCVDAELKRNFLSHPDYGIISRVFASVMAFAINHRFRDYYASAN